MQAYTQTLDNNLRVIAVPIEESPTVTAMVMVNAGTRFETKRNNGISHFLEHMCFKGTKNRKPREVSQELDGLGAKSNAFTWYEFTGYYAKSRAEKLSNIFDVIADIYLNSYFPQEEMEKERGVIMEEINMYEDLPMQKVQELFRESVYGDQPAGWDVLGTKKNIEDMTRDDFVNYHDRHYQPQNTSVVIAGGVSKNVAFDLAEDYFADKARGSSVEQDEIEINQENPRVKMQTKDSDQAHLTVGFRSVGVHDDLYHPLELASTILGRGMSSRLFQKLRDEMGVCYYVNSKNEFYSDTGLFKVSAGIDNQRIDEVVNEIMQQFQALKNEQVEKEELQKAKEYLAGNKLMNLESSDSLAQYYGRRSILNQELQSPKEFVKKYKQITTADIQEASKKIFTPDRLNLALVGPEQDNSEIKALLNIE